jgi:hypothetical protein
MGNKVNKHLEFPGTRLRLVYGTYREIRIGDIVVYNKELYIVRGVKKLCAAVEKLTPCLLGGTIEQKSSNLTYYPPGNLGLFLSQKFYCTWAQYQEKLRDLYNIIGKFVVTDDQLRSEVLDNKILSRLYRMNGNIRRLSLDNAYVNLLHDYCEMVC